jgi:hypothetical protein
MDKAIVNEEIELSGKAVDGWSAMVMRANNRNLRWLEIACELIDNARAFHKENQPTTVLLCWWRQGKVKRFECIDHGIGGTDPDAFTSPGLSGGYERASGGSTFGTGLFTVECHLQAKMQICTFPQKGAGWHIRREISRGERARATPIDNDHNSRMEYGAPLDGGTRVVFDGIHKPIPQEITIDTLASDLGVKYANAIRCGELHVTLQRNENRHVIAAATGPTLLESYSEVVISDGHEFNVVWGTTTTPNHFAGVELIYGGKQFDITAIPCGEFNVKFFYGSITIPRSFGKDAMDLLKRDIDDELMACVYDRCAELFHHALSESHRRATTKEQHDLNNRISHLLSEMAKKDQQPEDHGSDDIRVFNGRDPEGEGVKPKDTGRIRRGRRNPGRKAKAESPVDVHWQPLGERQSIAVYEVASNRLTFNEDNQKASMWRKLNKDEHLAIVGAAIMADKLRTRSDTGYGTFDWQLTKLCNRLP